MKIPTEIFAGDSYTWEDDPTTDNLGNAIDSAAWTLKYDFRQSAVANLTLTATANGSGWTTSLTAAQSVLWAAGKVYWQAHATSGLLRKTLGSGAMNVKLNIAASSALGAGEFRTQAEQDLAAVQTAIRTLISGGAKAYTIGGRSLTKLDVPELLQLESKLKADVFREKKAARMANGLGNPSNVYVRFNK